MPRTNIQEIDYLPHDLPYSFYLHEHVFQTNIWSMDFLSLN